MIDHNSFDHKCISEMNLIQRHRAFSSSQHLFLWLQTCVINQVYYLMSFPFKLNAFTLHPDNVCSRYRKSPVLTPFSLRACVETHTHTHTHILLLIYIEDQNPKLLGLGLVMLAMYLVVCLWSYTEGPLLLSSSLLIQICWSLRKSWNILSICTPGYLVMYRCGEGTAPQSHDNQESD